MQNIDLKSLGENIEKVFLEQDKYVFEKKVTEFNVEGKFVGDIINFLMFDPPLPRQLFMRCLPHLI